MKEQEIKKILSNIVNSYISGSFDSIKAIQKLMDSIEPEEIYNSDNLMITDCYFAIKHLGEIGYETSHLEIEYFKECLEGLRQYSLEEKNNYILKK